MYASTTHIKSGKKMGMASELSDQNPRDISTWIGNKSTDPVQERTSE